MCVARLPPQKTDAARMSFTNDDSTSISGHRLAPSGAGKLHWPTAWSPGQKSISIPLGFDRNTKCGPRGNFGERSCDCTAYVLDKTTPIIIRRCQFRGEASLMRPGVSLPTFVHSPPALEGLDLCRDHKLKAGRTAGWKLGRFHLASIFGS